LAKAAPRKLKVYQAQIGFFDSVVAAPNQAAALGAWGTHQNLFAEGRAKVASDPAAVAAALAHPEVPLRRPVGSDDAYTLDPGAPQVPAGRARTGLSRAKAPPDRRKLDEAEAALAKIEAEGERAEVDLRARREALEAEAAEAKQDRDRRRLAAQKVIERERRAFRQAGGEP
jgi:hypothetical protein